MDLSKRHLQLFFKRLRKAHGSEHHPIKYYAVGEYGTERRRPHYHLILFNADIKLIQSAWKLGQVHYDEVNEKTIGYCLMYIVNGTWKPMHRNDDRVPEFGVQSQGLGLAYLTEAMANWHAADIENRMYCNLDGGKKISMPRYYKEKLYFDGERKAAQEKQKAQVLAQEKKEREELGDEVYEWNKKQSIIRMDNEQKNYKSKKKKL